MFYMIFVYDHLLSKTENPSTKQQKHGNTGDKRSTWRGKVMSETEHKTTFHLDRKKYYYPWWERTG